ncbi:GtrA family protein [Streptococcus minor]|uniref:GtrA family protein n=1 Tax=Streptococcus minor TaxID=229549 RepID=A0A3P1VBF4_9STRE|nr:GtrA family protein [Streptococcus minor]RRD31471.1 GtrA family protein [Streptococcus minor]
MKNIRSFLVTFLKSEVFKYLFFGVLTTIVSIVTRDVLFILTRHVTFAVLVSNVTAVIFAFFTNDRFVFVQERKGWFIRFVKFFIARLSTLVLDLALAYLLVEKFPQIIGQFVNNDVIWVNRIETILAQVLIMVTNYVISKWLVFKDRKIQD